MGIGVNYAQKNTGNLSLASIPLPQVKKMDLNPFQPKTINCEDTLRYGYVKQEIVAPGSNYYFFDIWNVDNESISQTYLLSGASISLKKVEIIARNMPSTGNFTNSVSNAILNVQIYNVDANNVPTTLIGSTTTTIQGYAQDFYYPTFANPLTISGNYAIVLTPTTTNAIVQFFIGENTHNQSYDENFCKIKSTYPLYTSNGNYISPQDFTQGFTGGPINFDLIASPIVSYQISNTVNTSPIEVCLGQPVSFSATASPETVLANRMFNYNVLVDYFTPASDTTFIWNVNTASNTFIFQKDHNYTYTSPGTYNTRFFSLGGMSTTCLESTTGPIITVKQVPTTLASTNNTAICSGQTATLSATGAGTYSWDNGAGISNTVTVTLTSTTTYTVTGDLNGCTSTAQVTVNVNPVIVADFNYSAAVFCAGSSNQLPTVTNAGTFSATPSGLTINATTGEVDIVSSSNGTYTITHTTSGNCSDTKTKTLTISNGFDATFSYASTVYCASAANPTPVFTGGASAGVFSSTSGLDINSSTGTINVANSIAGTYTITNTHAAVGSCDVTSYTFDVTITPGITATITGGGATCVGSNPIIVTVNLTGSGPWDFTYSNGTTSTTLTNQAQIVNIAATSSGTYTLTSVSTPTCVGTVSGIANVEIHPLPTLTISPVNSLCVAANSIYLSATPAGGAFTGTGVIGSSFEPSIAGIGTHTITYAYTDANTCTNQVSTQISVTGNPTANITPIAAICSNASAINLAATPAGGTFTGVGVNATNFNPTIAGAGTHTITYAVSENNCTANATAVITVLAAPTTTLAPLNSTCINYAATNLSGGLPTGGIYSGAGVTNNSFNPSTAGVGSHSITYTYQNTEGCSASASQALIVDACLDATSITGLNLTIFPNPATNQLTIQSNLNVPVHYYLTTTDGKIILENQHIVDGVQTIDVSSFASGIYFLNFTSQVGSGIEKISIQ